MRLTVLIVPLFCALPAVASQPYSQSLAQCAALIDQPSRLSPHRATRTQKGRALAVLSERFVAEAVVQAGREGNADPEAAVATLYAAAAGDWDARGLRFFFTNEARDWIDYCRSFGLELGIDLSPPG